MNLALKRLIYVGITLFVSACGGGGTGFSNDSANSNPSQNLNQKEDSAISQSGWGEPLGVATAPDQISATVRLADDSTLILLVNDQAPAKLQLSRIAKDGSLIESNIVAVAERRGSGPWNQFNQPAMKTVDGQHVYISWLHSVWSTSNSEAYNDLHVKKYTVGSGLGEDAIFEADSSGSVLSYQLSVANDGDVWVGWVETSPIDPVSSPRGPKTVYVSKLGLQDKWSSPEKVSGGDQDISSISMVAGFGGRVAVAWRQMVDSYHVALRVVQNGIPTGWASPVTIYQSSANECLYGFEVLDLQLALDRFGDLMAVWQLASHSCDNGGVAYNYFDVNSGWSGYDIVSNSGMMPRVVMNDSGRGMLAWIDVSADLSSFVVLAANYDRNGGGEAVVVSKVDYPYGEVYPRPPFLVLDQDGNAAVTWVQDLYNKWSIVRGSKFSILEWWTENVDLSPYKDDEGITQDFISSSLDGRVDLIWRQGDLTGGAGRSRSWLYRFDLTSH